MAASKNDQSLKTHYLFHRSCSLLLLIITLACWVTVVSCSSIVTVLPGFSGPLPFELETGYVSVDDSNDVQLFYYFVKSERNPSEDPLLLWMSGGPYCSSFHAFIYEIGPLYFDIVGYAGGLPTLELNRDSWTKVANIIFLDQPVGTGFSYSRAYQGSIMGDEESARDSYIFLRKWLMDHPEFLSNRLYIGGDSYSGMVIPLLVQEIVNDIEAGKKPLLNFKGYLLGNALTDSHLETNAKVSFAHRMGLISDELYESMKIYCRGEYVNIDPSNVECLKGYDEYLKCTAWIFIMHILEPMCADALPSDYNAKGRRSLAESREFHLSQAIPPGKCRYYGYNISNIWAKDDSVQKALHIRKGTGREWTRCRNLHHAPLPYNSGASRIENHRNLSSKGYRSLIYSGDHDLGVSHESTEAWIRSLDFSIIDDWRPWFVNGQIAGYTRTYSNGMTYATVKGAGHLAPESRPAECFAMFERWVSDSPL